MGLIGLRTAHRARAARGRSAWTQVFACVGCVFAAGFIRAEPLHFGASASITETYTSNVNYASEGQAKGDFLTSVSAAVNLGGETSGKRLKVSGSIGLGQQLYVGQTQNNTIVPNVNLTAKLEAIENFLFVDARAQISPTFLSPFGAQPADNVNATQNRYTQQNYSLSPYLRGVLPSTTISYQLRDDSLWTIASKFGNASLGVPSTYANQFSASLSSPARPLGWSLDYSRSYYDNGLENVSNVGQGTFTSQSLRLSVPYQLDSQLQFSARAGTESNQYPFTSSRNITYGVGGQWSPSERTHVGGFWDHRFFGGSYSLQISHRLPNTALSANFSRNLSTYPQLALSIPAGAAVAQFIDSAFTTRIPDPAERTLAVEQFLANSGLPATLASPVNFYSANATVQQSASVSLVLIGAHNSLSFSLFNVNSEAVSGTGAILPPTLQFAQNNTQLGGSVAYSHSLGGRVNLGANASYSRAMANASERTSVNRRSTNGHFGLNLGTQVGPKTSASAGMGYSRSESVALTAAGTTSALNVFASINHTF